MLYGVSTLCDRGYQRQGGEVMFLEVSGMEEPRGGNRGGVKTPAGEVLNKFHRESDCFLIADRTLD
jgi:hypothetical protein